VGSSFRNVYTRKFFKNSREREIKCNLLVLSAEKKYSGLKEILSSTALKEEHEKAYGRRLLELS